MEGTVEDMAEDTVPTVAVVTIRTAGAMTRMARITAEVTTLTGKITEEEAMILTAKSTAETTVLTIKDTAATTILTDTPMVTVILMGMEGTTSIRDTGITRLYFRIQL